MRELDIDERITSAEALKTLRELMHLQHVHVASRRSSTIGPAESEEDRKLEEALPGKVSVMSDDAG